ncbi:uncharacterized protein LOC125477009 [Pyrus x bretschneideri]|uniref:uncharacterized protein LOC125477009 n=1 Tax=Pyrus x bretschneideri TaxID=225117 RepID=UPI0020304C13|nr:uncharacterized protein LOC125477009 [Pyrus x bretschneideri]
MKQTPGVVDLQMNRSSRPEALILPSNLLKFLTEVNNSPSQQVVHGGSPRWSCPPSGRLKLNVDGAWEKENYVGGVGVIIRNDEGSFMGAATYMFMDVFSRIQVEALAMRVSLEMVVERDLNKIIIESDAFQIISAMKEPSVNSSLIGPIIEDIKVLLSMVTEASVAHVCRQANSVAHKLARFALHGGGNCGCLNPSISANGYVPDSENLNNI